MFAIQQFSDPKDPIENAIYTIGLAGLLASVAQDSITGTPVVSASPAGLNIGAVTLTGTDVSFFVSGGTDQQDYLIKVVVATQSNQTLVGSVGLSVQRK